MSASKKVFWFDVETSGLKPGINDILTLGVIIEVDGKICYENELLLAPYFPENITEGALKSNGLLREDILKFPHGGETFKELKKQMLKVINPYDKKDKFYVGGHNVGFDVEFLSEFWKKNKDDYLFSFLSSARLDSMYLASYLKYKGVLPETLPNLKLETLTSYFGISYKAHNALEDIRATRKVFSELERIQSEGIKPVC